MTIRADIRSRIDPTLRASGSTTVSFVYPTRNRPDFLREGLTTLGMQQGGSFEVVVSDNYSDQSRSSERVCQESGIAGLRYLHPARSLSMAENWEHALSSATGEYVAYLGDKMFALPNALWHIEQVAAEKPEIITWVADNYFPASCPDYFGSGSYVPGQPGSGGSFDPVAELSRRGVTGRSGNDQPDYSRGKIVFGAFHRDLVARIMDRFGGLFHVADWGTTGLSPDYTSMILGLSEARSAVELRAGCVIQIHTDISGGMLIDRHDAIARATLPEATWPDLPIPGLYASSHNIVARDYVALKEKFDLPFDFDPDVWVRYCESDINRPERVWSSPEVEAQQKGILAKFIAQTREG